MSVLCIFHNNSFIRLNTKKSLNIDQRTDSKLAMLVLDIRSFKNESGCMVSCVDWCFSSKLKIVTVSNIVLRYIKKEVTLEEK